MKKYEPKVILMLLQQRQQLVTALIDANNTSDIQTKPLLSALCTFDPVLSELLSNLQKTKQDNIDNKKLNWYGIPDKEIIKVLGEIVAFPNNMILKVTGEKFLDIQESLFTLQKKYR